MNLPSKCLVVIALINLCGCSQPKKQQQLLQDHQELNASIQNDLLTDQAMKSTGSGVHRIEIKGMKFKPEQIFVNAGDTIVWLNKDVVVHDVTEFNAKKWASSRLDPTSSWAKIIQEGDEYFCSLHVVMKGKIILK